MIACVASKSTDTIRTCIGGILDVALRVMGTAMHYAVFFTKIVIKVVTFYARDKLTSTRGSIALSGAFEKIRSTVKTLRTAMDKVVLTEIFYAHRAILLLTYIAVTLFIFTSSIGTECLNYAGMTNTAISTA